MSHAKGLLRLRKRMVAMAGGVVAAFAVASASPASASGLVYVGDRLDAYMECDIAQVSITAAIVDATYPRITGDGYKDWALFEFWHYTGTQWVRDSYSTYMYNTDSPSRSGTYWYEYGTNIQTPTYVRSYPSYTEVAVRVEIYSGRDSTWYWTWAMSRRTTPQGPSCRTLAKVCFTAYQCLAVDTPPQNFTVGGVPAPGVS